MKASDSTGGLRQDSDYESKKEAFMDIDRMVNDGLGGGRVTPDNGYIGSTTTDTMDGSQAMIGRGESGWMQRARRKF